ncbi:MAG: hypothetical protein PHW47_00670 [Lachnospira sp.]|nr:hypothetical protein [Lachnospira sp.]
MKKILFTIFLLIPVIVFGQIKKVPSINSKPIGMNSAIQNEDNRIKKESEELNRAKEVNDYKLTIYDLINNSTYEKSFEVNNTKNILWNNIVNWYSVNKNKYGLSIISENKDTGRIYFQIKCPISIDNDAERTGHIKLYYLFTIQVDCKDKKFRYIISSRKSEIRLKRGENLKDLSTSTLTAIQSQLQDIVSISENYFNKQSSWEFNKVWNNFIKNEYSYNELNPKAILNSGLNTEKVILENIYIEMIKKDDW